MWTARDILYNVLDGYENWDVRVYKRTPILEGLVYVKLDEDLGDATELVVELVKNRECACGGSCHCGKTG